MDNSSSFVKYRVKSGYGHLKHPSVIVETVSLASVPMSPPNYQHSVPLQLLKTEDPVISGEQMDAVLYAGESHSTQIKTGDHSFTQGFGIGKQKAA